MSETLRLGVDIGGTKVGYALGSPRGEIVTSARESFPATGSATRDLDAIAARAHALVAERGARIEAVGIAAPGPLDWEAGRVLSPPNLPGWEDVALRDALAERLGVAAAVENDANAAALAEWRHGAGRGSERMLYLTMSTGVGGGFILDGALYRGEFSSAGEIGHAPLVWDGELCRCGFRGCLEAYIGGAAWAERLRRETPETSAVLASAGAREAIRPEHVVAAAGQGDAFARAEMDRYNHYLAWGIAHLVFVLAPQRVVLGTIPSAAGDALCLDPVRAQVRERIWSFLADSLEIVAASLGPDLSARAGLAVAELALETS